MLTTYRQKHKSMDCPVCGKPLIESIAFDEVACSDPECSFNKSKVVQTTTSAKPSDEVTCFVSSFYPIQYYDWEGKLIKEGQIITIIPDAIQSIQTINNFTEYQITCLAMAIVNHTNEKNGVDVDTRQKNNDECFDFAVAKIKEFLNI